MCCRIHMLLLLIVVMMPMHVAAQEPVAACTRWLATVDENTQQIILSWHPSADTSAMGYHICTGTPCIDYDTVFGRFDTSYICLDHSPLEAHTYRLHVFDTAYNVSSLTEPFGNMVLQADVPECDPNISIHWNAYPGMPGGVSGYRLMARIEPEYDDYVTLRSFSPDDTLAYSYELPPWATTVHLKVLATDTTGTLVSQSNVVSVDRRTIDTASFVEIFRLHYDSLRAAVVLDFNIDTSYHGADHYTLWRSIDYSPWRVLDTGVWLQYTDTEINVYDSLYCYQLSVFDACGINEKFSATSCIVMPTPPEPSVAIPNIIIAGDADNGAFRPNIIGLDDEVYELSIFNRQGLIVFTTTNPDEAWTPNTSVTQGAYTFHLRVRYVDGIVQSYIGTVIVVK